MRYAGYYLPRPDGRTFDTVWLAEGETPWPYRPSLYVDVPPFTRIVEVYAGPPAPNPHCAHDRRQHDTHGCTWTEPAGTGRCWCSASYMSLRPMAANG